MSVSQRIRYTIEAVNLTKQEFAEIENGLERLRKARLSASRVVLEEQRAQRFLSQAYRAQHQQFMDTISVMRSVGYIGRGILTMWQAYTIGQMHVAESLGRVEEAQIAVNTALDLYGETSVVYQDAVSDLEKLEAAAEKAQNSINAGYVTMGLTAVGTIAQLGSLIVKLGLVEQAALAIPVAIGAALAVQGLTVAAEGPEAVAETIGLERGAEVFGGVMDWLNNVLGAIGTAAGNVAGNISINQFNYGVEGAQDSLSALEDLLNSYLTNEP